MTISEIKTRIHDKIDAIQDPELLQRYFEILEEESGQKSDPTCWDNLTDEQRADIEQAYLEAEDETQLIPHEEVMKNFAEWVKK